MGLDLFIYFVRVLGDSDAGPGISVRERLVWFVLKEW